MDKIAKALAILREKPRSRREWSMDDLVLNSMSRTMDGLVGLHRQAGHSFDAKLKMSDGSEVTIEKGMAHVHWRERLEELINGAQAIAQIKGCSENSIIKDVMAADGWVVNDQTVKTPAWMVSHREFSRDYLADEVKGLRWLAGSL